MRGPACIALALTVQLPSSSLAAPSAGLRFATVLEESLDGVKRSSSSAETELTTLLLDAGLVLIDERQSRKLREARNASELVSGTLPSAITPADADRILAGHCRISRIESDILPSNVFRYGASLEARLILVDSAQVLASIRARGEGMGYDREQAAAEAARKAAETLVKELLRSLRDGRVRVELEVTGIPSVAFAEQVVTALGRIPGLSEVKVLAIAPGLSKFSASVALEARALALAIDEARSAGLVVTGYTDRVVRAEWSAIRASGLSVAWAPLRRVGGRERDRWVDAAARSAMAIELAAVGIGVSESRDSDRSVLADGFYRIGPGGMEIDVSLVDESKVSVASAHARCGELELPSCAKGLGKELVATLEARLRAVPADGRHLQGSSVRPLRVLSVHVENLFPSRHLAYSKRPIGTVEVSSSGPETISEVELTTSVGRFTTSPLVRRFAPPLPGEVKKLPIEVVLDRRALVGHEENEPAILNLELDYVSNGFRAHQSLNEPLVIYAKNAMSWTEPDSVGAFVTSYSAPIQELARSLGGSTPSRAHPLALPIALYRGLGALGLVYLSDPASPGDSGMLDYLQYPGETLLRGGGDCDDLAVLYAASAEAIGLRTLLMTTPGHVLVAVSTGLPAQAAHLLDTVDGPERLVPRDGLLFVPLEPTRLGSSFRDAWVAASEELARWDGSPSSLETVDVRRSWTTFPPSSLTADSRDGAKPRIIPKLDAVVASELSELSSRRQLALERALAELDAEPQLPGESGRARLRRKAFLWVQAARLDEARAILEQLIEADGSDSAAVNDLANLSLVASRVSEARGLYRRAIAGVVGPRVIPMRLNAALAALADGDEEEFGKQITACLEAGAEAQVRTLAMAGVPSPGDRGSNELAVRDLARALESVLVQVRPQAGRVASDGPKASMERRLALDRYLHWLGAR
ncbi:MAG: hypothetical protein HYV07_12520 [Deltaproteobacteria bacterium]|nr:hypothetical protein [Deltaproteobacteria bacterium]